MSFNISHIANEKINVQNVGEYAKEPFKGSGNTEHVFTTLMSGFVIVNDGAEPLSFTINGDTFDVMPKEGFAGKFEYFVEVKVTANGAFRAHGIWTHTDLTAEDILPPSEVSNLVVSDLTNDSALLTYSPSISGNVEVYEIYNGSNLVGTTNDTTYEITPLTENTEHTLTVKAKSTGGKVSNGVSVSTKTYKTMDNVMRFVDVSKLVVNSSSAGWKMNWVKIKQNMELTKLQVSVAAGNPFEIWAVNQSTKALTTLIASGTFDTVGTLDSEASRQYFQGLINTPLNIPKDTYIAVAVNASVTGMTGTHVKGNGNNNYLIDVSETLASSGVTPTAGVKPQTGGTPVTFDYKLNLSFAQ